MVKVDTKLIPTQCPHPPLFLQGVGVGEGGGAKKFSMLAKRELAIFEFLGVGGVSKKGGVDIFREVEHFLKVKFNC